MTVRNYPVPFQGVDDHDSFSLTPEYGTLFRNVRSNRRRIVRSPGGTLMAPSPMPSDITSAVTVVTISTPTITGSQVYIHDLGDIPLGYFFTGAKVTAPEDTIQASTSRFFGLSDGTTHGAKAQSVENGTPANSNNTSSTAACILMTNSAGTVVVSGVVTASDAETLTINWTVVDTEQHTIGVTLVGGTGTVSCKVVNWNLQIALGNQAVTGVGFTPQIVIHLVRAPANSLVIGGMTVSGQFSNDDHVTHNFIPAQTQRITSFTKAIAQLTGTVPPPALEYSAVFVSMDADGFTVDIDNAPPGTQAITSLCIAGMGGAEIGGFVKTVASAPVNQPVTGTGFKPDWVMLAGSGTTSNAPALQGIRGVGFAVGSQSFGWASMVKQGSNPTVASQELLTNALYVRLNTARAEVVRGTLNSFDTDGFTVSWPLNDSTLEHIAYVALKGGAGSPVGVIRNYAQVYVGPGATVDEKLVMLTSKSAFVYTPVDDSTGVWTPTSEIYNGTDTQRFSIVNTQAVAAWSQGVDNIRQWDGVTFSSLVQAGQNHAAKALIAFADRIISIRPFFAGIDHATQIRWSVDGNVNDWTGAGSGALEIIETSQNPLVTGFVLGSRAYLAKQRELIELIWTGTTSPVFGTTPRVRGMGILAPHSVGLGEQFAFWLGPDDVYMWDGSTLTPIGERIYNTIDPLIDYNNLDTIQGAVWTPDDLYLLVVPPYRFVYDYRRDIWYQDDVVNFEAIGIFAVGTNFTADIDHSEFVVIGDSAVQTIREVPTLTDYLGTAIDSYWTTKDYTSEELRQSFGFQVSLWNENSLREIRFQSNAGYIVEVGVSVDRGTTWQTTTITVNSQGVGVAWFQIAFNQIRFRFRRYAIEPYEIHGQWGIDTEDAGYELPNS